MCILCGCKGGPMIPTSIAKPTTKEIKMNLNSISKVFDQIKNCNSLFKFPPTNINAMIE